MQHFYKAPEMEILEIGQADVITASPAENTDPGKTDLDWLGV